MTKGWGAICFALEPGSLAPLVRTARAPFNEMYSGALAVLLLGNASFVRRFER
jgi:hypothetical protein